jgi:nitroreductase
MDFDRIIQRRRMVRSFRSDPVSTETVERIVDVARRAPSAGFSQGVEFVIVTEPVLRDKVVAIASVGERMRAGLAPAPAHIVLCVSADVYRQRYREPDKQRIRANMSDDDLWHVPFWWVDAGAAMMSLLLAAGNEGLASFFYGVWRTAELSTVLDIPNAYTPAGIVTIGHRAESERPQGSTITRRRRPAEHVVHWNRW